MDTYVDRLVHELRRHEVPGQRIGQVIAEVEAHSADSGEDPAEAFGDPATYADRIAAALGPPVRPFAARPRALLIAYPILLGTLLLLDGIWAALRGEPVRVTAGEAALAAVLPVIGLALVTVFGGPGHRAPDRLAWPVGAVLAPAMLAVLVLLREPVLLSVAAWPAVAAGAARILAGSALVHGDRVVDPRDGRNRARLGAGPWLLMAALAGVPLSALLILAVLGR